MPPKAAKAPSAQATAYVNASRTKDLFNILIGLRIFNALTLSTFFQPDEYYQALEPAWQIAFGKGVQAWNDGARDGPWLTWEWNHKLRSSLYPMIYAGIYKAVNFVAKSLFPPVISSKLIINAPKLFQAFGAGLMDYYTFQLAGRVYGPYSSEAWATLGLSVFSPWHWLASTRSMSNSFETTLTVMALYYWPWEWLKGSTDKAARRKDADNLMYTVLLAGFASVLRPTNVIIWICLSLFTLPRANQREFFAMVNAASLWGYVDILFWSRTITQLTFLHFSSVVLGVSMASDYWYYGEITFPPLNFYKINLEAGMASFYGINRIDYYFTEAIPLLLSTALPFAITGLSQALAGRFLTLPADTESGATYPSVLRSLATAAVALPLALSFVDHKEVRFIYPILPILLVIISRPVIAFFHPFPSPTGLRKFILRGLVLVNIALSIYFGFFHNRGVIGAVSFVRSELERLNSDLVNKGITKDLNVTDVAFLMPCHSVPWRSHLIYPDLLAWSLTCEPPLNKTDEELKKYLPEHDYFYKDPDRWIRLEFGTQKRSWPNYVVFYEQLEPQMKHSVTKYAFEEAWRGFNSLWHDDWRRKGDVIVWAKTKPFGGTGREHNALEDIPDDADLDPGTRVLRDGWSSEQKDTMKKMGGMSGMLKGMHGGQDVQEGPDGLPPLPDMKSKVPI